MPKCQVINCDDKNSTRHRFPNPKKNPRQFEIWIKATGNTKLEKIDSDKIYKNLRICHRHFGAENRSTNMYLKPNVYPTLFLPINFSPTIEFENPIIQENLPPKPAIPCEATGKMITVPSLNNWAISLEAFKFLTFNLKHRFNIKFFMPRRLNQDPLENFFGQMRQHGGRNINPNVPVFINHFKTLLVNNLVIHILLLLLKLFLILLLYIS
ncbi:hypothetical protein ABEB36_014533 [Hypothenemus hampei]|uniref:THAP-type domain-containing protein n=1 Tax=Hypothenemus hampei TaxID=57062 RepID=A0ABD1E4T9_HYPHA